MTFSINKLLKALNQPQSDESAPWTFKKMDRPNDFKLSCGHRDAYLTVTDERLFLLYVEKDEDDLLAKTIAAALQQAGSSGFVYCGSKPAADIRTKFLPITTRDREMLGWVPASSSWGFDLIKSKGRKIIFSFPHCQSKFPLEFQENALVIHVGMTLHEGTPKKETVCLSTPEEAQAFFALFLEKEQLIQDLLDQLISKAKEYDPKTFHFIRNIVAFRQLFRAEFNYSRPFLPVEWITTSFEKGKPSRQMIIRNQQETKELFIQEALDLMETNLRKVRMHALFQKGKNDFLYEVAFRTFNESANLETVYQGPIPLSLIEEQTRSYIDTYGVPAISISNEERRAIKQYLGGLPSPDGYVSTPMDVFSLGSYYFISSRLKGETQFFFEPCGLLDQCLNKSAK